MICSMLNAWSCACADGDAARPAGPAALGTPGLVPAPLLVQIAIQSAAVVLVPRHLVCGAVLLRSACLSSRARPDLSRHPCARHWHLPAPGLRELHDAADRTGCRSYPHGMSQRSKCPRPERLLACGVAPCDASEQGDPPRRPTRRSADKWPPQ